MYHKCSYVSSHEIYYRNKVQVYPNKVQVANTEKSILLVFDGNHMNLLQIKYFFGIVLVICLNLAVFSTVVHQFKIGENIMSIEPYSEDHIDTTMLEIAEKYCK